MKLLGCCGSAGGVCVLTDDYTSVCDQGLCCCALLVNIKPGVRILNFHCNVGNNAADAEEESGVAGYNLCVGISAYIADLYISVSVEASGLGLCAEGSVSQKLLQLHSGNHTGYITGLVNACKCILKVG